MTKRPYRILRFKEGVTPISIGYATKEARDKKGQNYADRDGYVVGAEEWRDDNWWLTGQFEPATCRHEKVVAKVLNFPQGPTRLIQKCEDCGTTRSEPLIDS